MHFYNKTISKIESLAIAKDRVRARTLFDGVLVSWVGLLLLTFIERKTAHLLIKSIVFDVVLTICFLQFQYWFSKWIYAMHYIIIGLIGVIFYEIIAPGQTPDMILVQHTFMAVFFSYYIILNKWSHVYSGIAIFGLACILFRRDAMHPPSSDNSFTNIYIITYSFSIVLFVICKYLFTLRKLVDSVEISRSKGRLLFQNIKSAAIKADRLDNEKTVFFSTISHELRTPLNSIVGFVNLLKTESQNEEVSENLNLLYFSTEYLASTINNVMVSSAASYSKDLLGATSFDLIPLIHTIIKGLKLKADQKGIALDLKYADALLGYQVICMKDRLVQIIYNLVDNAIKFTPEGSVTIHIFETKREGCHALLTFNIVDTGIGIEEDKIKDIFCPFKQASVKINSEFGGTGLGLSIVRKLLHAMDSEIHCSSELGKGSCFSFCINFKIPNFKSIYTVADDIKITSNTLSGLRMLVVEDHHLNIILICRILDTWGVQYDVAMDGKQAIDCSQKQKYDIILMDINMPVMNGLESAEKIRRLHPQQKIIFLTANIQNEVIEEMSNLNGSGYLIKPFKAIELRALIFKTLKINA